MIEGTIERLSAKLGDEKAKILSALWERFESLCRMAEPQRKVSICRDPKDDAYLSLCASVRADYLITGDKDLLAVEPSRFSVFPKGLKILTPRQFLEIVVW
jgi:putative PIN family toxin of toxin-antitoxin system